MKPKKYRNETKEQYIIRVSKELQNEGYHISEIASKLKCNKFEIYNILVPEKYKFTTEEERQKMISLRKQGYSLREISKIVGRSHTCVRSRLLSPITLREDYKEYNINDRTLKKIKNYYINGKSIKWISEKTNLPENAIEYRLKRAKLFKSKITVNKVTEEEAELFNDLYYNKGYSMDKIAKQCKRDRGTVSKHLKK